MSPFKTTSHILLYTIHWSPNPDEEKTFLVTRWDTDDTVILGELESDITKEFWAGHSISQIAKRLDLSENKVLQHANFLLDAGFVKQIDTIHVPEMLEKIHPWFPSIKKEWFTWAIHPVFLVIACIFILSGVYIGLSHSDYFPTVNDFFWTGDIAIAFLVNMLLGYVIVFIHESAHFIATRAIGGQARVSISYRFIYLVFQTESFRILPKPKKLRYFVYLAGIFADFVLIGIIYWLLFITDQTSPLPPEVRILARSLVLVLFSGICWQLNAYLETDIYNFISDFLNQPNLYNNMLKTLRSLLTKLPGGSVVEPMLIDNEKLDTAADDLRTFTKSQREQIYLYMIVFFVGITTTIIIFSYIIIPREIQFLYRSLELLLEAVTAAQPWDVLKYIGLSFIIVYQYFLVLGLFIRNRLKKTPHLRK